MPRRRRNNPELPTGLFKHGRKYRTRKGKNEWHYLGEDLGKALTEYARLLEGMKKGVLSIAMDRYLRDEMPKKAPKTQLAQVPQLERLRRVFGHMPPDEIRQSDAIAYLDTRGKIVANREIALLRHVLTKCVHWDYVGRNPLLNMQYRIKEKARNREVSASERRWVMRRAQPRERYIIWLIYIIGMRREDVLSLSRWDCKKDYLYINEQKTGKRVRIVWTRSLERVTKRLIKLSPDYRLFPVSESGFDSAWQRLRKKLAIEQPGYELFQLKDLRAEHAGEIEDKGGNATLQLDHSSRATTKKHYLRRGRIITPIR